MIRLMRIITCPFCGKEHVSSAYVNVICPCGAKYYIHNNEFWDRKGTIVKNVESQLLEHEG